MEEETLTATAPGCGEKGRKGGLRPTSRERFAVQVADVIGQMSSSEDGPLRVTLYFLYQEYLEGSESPIRTIAQIADGAGLSRDRARTALINLQGEGWVRAAGRSSWQWLSIRAARD
jgi:hypothetical protein